MKRLAILSLALLSLHIMHAQKDSTIHYTLFSSSRSLEKSNSIDINFEKVSFEKVKQKLPLLKNLVHLKLEGYLPDSCWNLLFTDCQHLTKLKSIRLVNCNIETLPASFFALKNLQSFTAEACDFTDWKKFFTEWQTLSSLKNCRLDLWSLEELGEKVQFPPQLSNLSLTEFAYEETVPDATKAKQEPSQFNFVQNKDGKKLDLSVTSEKNLGEVQKQLSEAIPDLGMSSAWQSASSLSTTKIIDPSLDFSPLARSVVRTENFSVPTNESQTIWLSSGTIIDIPENAFVYRDGSPVKTEDIQMEIHEYKDAFDILLNQIPMKLDSTGKNFQLESAGMISIKAFANNNPLELNPGKNLAINFNSADSGKDFNMYAYNNTTRTWNTSDQVKQQGQVVAKAKTLPLTAGCQKYTDALRHRPRPKDTTLYSARFYNANYTNMLNNVYFSNRKWHDYKVKRSYYKKVVRIIHTHNTIDTNIVFKLEKKSTYLDKELSAYHHCWWKLDEPLDARTFRKTFQSGKRYNDIRITADGNNAVINLKTENGYKTIHAHPVILSGHDKTYEYRDQGAHFYKNYARTLKFADRNFKRKLKKNTIMENEYYLPEAKATEQTAFEEAKRYMNKKEKIMDLKQWKDYYKKVMAENNRYTPFTYDNPFNKAFTVNKLGIYNCDRILQMVQPVEVLVKYVDSTGAEIVPVTNYVLNANVRSVWCFYSPSGVTLSGKSLNQIYVVSYDQKFYKATLNPQEYNLQSGLQYTVRLSPVALDNKSAAEIAKELALN